VATTRVHFQAEIEDFRSGLVEMASLVLAQVERGVAAWEDVDRAAAAEVVEGDELVDQRCVELDQKIFNLQLLEAPVASDLRLLHVGLIGVIALERVGDLAVAIANAATSVRPEGADSTIQAQISRMSAHAVDVLAQADAAGVRRMLDEVVQAVGALPSEELETRAWAAAAVLVARHLERVANNGAELGGRVRFLVTGEPFTRDQAHS
jgi:phosphate transport system protein